MRVSLQLNGKKPVGRQSRLMSWDWKRKPTWRKDLIAYSSHPWILFSFNWLAIIWKRGILLKLDVEDQGGGRILDVGGQREWRWRVTENWTIFLGVICVSSLILHTTSQYASLHFKSYANVRTLFGRGQNNYCAFLIKQANKEK